MIAFPDEETFEIDPNELLRLILEAIIPIIRQVISEHVAQVNEID